MFATHHFQILHEKVLWLVLLIKNAFEPRVKFKLTFEAAFGKGLHKQQTPLLRSGV